MAEIETDRPMPDTWQMAERQRDRETERQRDRERMTDIQRQAMT